jgi:hypothetical protein
MKLMQKAISQNVFLNTQSARGAQITMNLLEKFCSNHYCPILLFPINRNQTAGKYVYANSSAEYFFGESKAIMKMTPSAIDAHEQSPSLADEIKATYISSHHYFRRTVVDRIGGEADTMITLTMIREGDKVFMVQQIDYLSAYGTLFGDPQKRLLELEKDLKGAKLLKGTMTVCMECRKVKTQSNRWVPFESYFWSNSALGSTHGFCPKCFKVVQKKIKNHQFPISSRGQRQAPAAS